MLRRVLDDQGRLFGRVNIVDLIVLVVIVGVVVFAAFRLTSGGSVGSVPVKVSFMDARVDQAVVAGLQTKGTIKDAAGNVIGDVQGVQVVPTIEELVTADGELKTFQSTIHKDVTFVVIGKGTVSDSTVHIGSVAARVGAVVKLFGPGYEAQTVIVNVVSGAEALK